jgi:serine/threonine protein kinase
MLSLSRELLGKSIGSYHLSKLIGLGGTGAVFLGSDDDGHEMAVKILIPPILISEESLREFHKRFQREAEILSQLRHPHILPVTDFGTDKDSGFPYMIMPYKSGGTLVEQIQEGPLPFDKAMKYVWQLSQALSYAHKQNIIHRDLKPANVLLDEDGQISLADFSIAKLFNLSTTTLTSANQMLGTPAYMAPEQVSNKPISPATDIYGLAILTYQLLTGSLPFDVSTLLALLQRIIQESPPPAHGIRTDLPPEASDVLLKALAKEPEERFQDAEDFARALDQSMQPVLTPSALLQATQKKWETVQLAEDSTPVIEEASTNENVDEAEVAEAASSTNDPTIVAYYATTPLESEQISAVPTHHTPSAHKSLKRVRLHDEDSTPAQIADSSSSANNQAPFQKDFSAEAASHQEQENNEAVSLPAEDDSQPAEQEGTQQSASHETMPMATEQQISVIPDKGEAVEALVTVIATRQLSNTSSPFHELATLPTTPLPLEKSIVNQPAHLHAAISKKPSRFSFKRPWPRWQIISAALLLLFLAGEGIFSLYASGHGLFVHQNSSTPTPLPPATSAIIGITPDSETLQKTFTITAITGFPDTKKHQVLARWVYDSTQSHQRTVNATGKVSNPAATASGTLLFVNSSFTGPVAVPAGTTLTGQGKNANVQVVLDEPVSIPAAPPNYVDPKQRPMQRVRAHYATDGAAGNIGAQKFSFASGACIPANPVCYSASNDAPFIGGTDAQNYTFVQQSDIDGASKALQALAPDPQQQLQGQLSASEQWIVTPSCQPQTTSNHAVNDKVPNFIVTVTFACSGEAYDQKGALEAAKQELKENAAKNPGADYMLNGDINATEPKAPALDANGVVNMTIDTKGTWIFQLSDTKKQDIARSVIGKKKLAVQDMLKSLKGIKNVTIQLNDGDQNTFPADPQNITINIASA